MKKNKTEKKHLKWSQHGGCLGCGGSVGIFLCTGWRLLCGLARDKQRWNPGFVLIRFHKVQDSVTKEEKKEVKWICPAEWLEWLEFKWRGHSSLLFFFMPVVLNSRQIHSYYYLLEDDTFWLWMHLIHTNLSYTGRLVSFSSYDQHEKWLITPLQLAHLGIKFWYPYWMYYNIFLRQM